MENNQKQIIWEDIERKDGFYISKDLSGIAAQTAANYGVFFTAYHPCEILAVVENHMNAGSDAGTVTVGLEILNDGDLLDAGDSVLVSDFNLKSAGAYYSMKRGVDLSSTRQLKIGDRLALKDTGTLTDVQGVIITVYMKYLGRGHYR